MYRFSIFVMAVNWFSVFIFILDRNAFIINAKDWSTLFIKAIAGHASFVIAASWFTFFIISMNRLIIFIENWLPNNRKLIIKEVNNRATICFKTEHWNSILCVTKMRRLIFFFVNFAKFWITLLIKINNWLSILSKINNWLIIFIK